MSKRKNGFEHPRWLEQKVWQAFIEHRKKLRKPMTDYAQYLIVRRLTQFRSRGHNPTEVLELSIEMGWQGVFEPRKKTDDPFDGAL